MINIRISITVNEKIKINNKTLYVINLLKFKYI
jgi:hypothetical protein